MRGAHGNPIWKKCPTCGRQFRTYKSRLDVGKGTWCSVVCAYASRRKTVTCLGCGKKWEHPISQRGDMWCSASCRTRHSLEDVVCRWCGKKFKAYKYKLLQGRGRHCSKECRNASYQKPEEHKKARRLEYVRKYRREHPEWTAEVKHRRRFRESKGHFTKEEWKAVKENQNFTCLICGKQEPEIKLTVDHIIPLFKGGGNELSNIQGLCKMCNSRKSWKIL